MIRCYTVTFIIATSCYRRANDSYSALSFAWVKLTSYRIIYKLRSSVRELKVCGIEIDARVACCTTRSADIRFTFVIITISEVRRKCARFELAGSLKIVPEIFDIQHR